MDLEDVTAPDGEPSSLEEALLKQLAHDEPDLAEEALRQLYQRHAPAVHLFATGVLQSEPLARLVVQDIFVDLYRRWESVDLAQESLRAYLLKQAHRRCVELEDNLSSSENDRPATSAAGDESGDAAPTTIGELAMADERVIIDLAHLGQMTYPEVAAFLNLSEHTVKVRLRDGLRRLRRR
ncbi:MAG: sigma-70 family RNA polymerase sigma factor [Actinomycetota bacterium]|nr:sigma-70 family RNA polymerase sigma factor [Actinomycetota bacterium]